MQAMNLTTNTKDDEIEIFASGEIDLGNIKDFEEILNQATQERKNVIIDMADVRFIDSTGIGLLVKTYKVLKQDGKSIEVRNAKGNVRKVFKITCLEDVFNMGVE